MSPALSDSTRTVALALLALIVGALSAGAETALTSTSSARLSALIEQSKSPLKEAYVRAEQHFSRLRATYLLGRLTGMVISAALIVDLLVLTTGRTGFIIAILVILAGAAIAFEIATALARHFSDVALALSVRFFRPVEWALWPAAVALAWVGDKIASHTAAPSAGDPKVAEAEVENLVDEVEKSGVFGHEPAEMIRNVIEFVDLTAQDVMIPRSRIVAVEIKTPLPSVLKYVAESGHSRYPVFDEDIDNVVALLYAKDLFRAVEEHGLKDLKLADIARGRANFVVQTQPLSSLLREMRQRRQHLAVVVDEHGQTAGIVTLEDIVEEIVGDIRDEHDEGGVTELADGRLVADGTVPIGDIASYLGTDFDGASDESLSAMLVRVHGKVPSTGTVLNRFGMRFIVREAEPAAVTKVEVLRAPRPATLG